MIDATDWNAHPNTARWYGEVTVGKDGEDTTYQYGYSNDDAPNVLDLVPEGWECLGETLNEIRPVES